MGALTDRQGETQGALRRFSNSACLNITKDVGRVVFLRNKFGTRWR